MSAPNPYKPPAAPVARPEKKRPLGPGDYALAALVVLQVLLVLYYLETLLTLTRAGAVTPLYLLGALAAVGGLAVGAVSFMTRRSGASYLFGLAGIFYGVLLIQGRELFAITGAAVALCACAYSAWRSHG